MFLDGTRFCGSGFGKTKLNDYFCLDIMPTQRCGRKKNKHSIHYYSR